MCPHWRGSLHAHEARVEGKGLLGADTGRSGEGLGPSQAPRRSTGVLMADLLGPQFSTQPGMRLADGPGAQHEAQASARVQMGTSGPGEEAVVPEARHPSAILTGDP